MTNIFEHLTFEEPSEAGDSGTNIRKEDVPENISLTVCDAALDDKKEAFIASIYLSLDAHRSWKTFARCGLLTSRAVSV